MLWGPALPGASCVTPSDLLHACTAPCSSPPPLHHSPARKPLGRTGAPSACRQRACRAALAARASGHGRAPGGGGLASATTCAGPINPPASRGAQAAAIGRAGGPRRRPWAIESSRIWARWLLASAAPRSSRERGRRRARQRNAPSRQCVTRKLSLPAWRAGWRRPSEPPMLKLGPRRTHNNTLIRLQGANRRHRHVPLHAHGPTALPAVQSRSYAPTGRSGGAR